jgi:hypothetical protein
MKYSKANLKRSGDKASPCFRSFRIGKLSEKYLPTQTLQYVSFKRILINLTRKARRKETTGKPRRRWMDNIRMDLREIGWDGMDWMDLAQDRDQWRALVKFLSSCRIGGSSRRAQLQE